MYKLYNLTDIISKINPAKVIIEDSNSGYEFYELIFGDKCESAGGKSKIYECVRKSDKDSILVIADGATFGADIGKVMRYLVVSEKKCVLYAPESFEYLILQDRIFDVPDASPKKKI